MGRALTLVGRLLGAALAATGLFIVGTVVVDAMWHRYDDDGWKTQPASWTGEAPWSGDAVLGAW
jgi:hypothetical protein